MSNPLRRAERLASKEESGLGITSWAWWPWSRKRHSRAQYATIRPGSTVEQKKYVFSVGFFSELTWHIWTVISCLVSGVLLYLNFSEYTIGTEIGKDRQGTRNILGSLQLAAKAHEIVMIVSLGNIVRQWVQQCLIDDGLLLGLVGAESSLSNLALLVSREFRAGIFCSIAMLGHQGEGQYAHHQRRRGKMMILLLACLALGCLLCSLVGPASAVLMVPRYDWFHEVNREMSVPLSYDEFIQQYEAGGFNTHYPNIFIAPELDERDIARRGIEFEVESPYWRKAMAFRGLSPHSTYLYVAPDGSTQSRINVTTLPGRHLTADNTWEGGTTLTSAMIPDILKTNLNLRGNNTAPTNRDSEIKYSAEVTGIEVNTVCRRQYYLPCDHVSGGTDCSPEWFYRSVTREPTKGDMQSSKELLFVHNSSDMRLWMTEGPKTDTNSKFSDSIVVVLEEVTGELFKKPSLIVCSVSAALMSGTASSSIYPFFPERLELHDGMIYFDGKSRTLGQPRKLLYHKSWLESIHGLNISKIDGTSSKYMANTTYPYRGREEEPLNKYLEEWGKGIRKAVGYGTDDYWWYPSIRPTEASLAETIIGGLFIYAFLRLEPSTSQYPQRDTRIPPAYPEELMDAHIEDHTLYEKPTVQIEHLLYGFKLGSRTSILSAVVLITHSILVLAGSLWQYRRVILIQAWGSMPEYVMLCLGSDPAHACSHVDNTCAGISQDKTLNKMVRIREVTKEHLELVVVSPETILLGSVVDREKRYGSFGEGSRLMKEKLE